MGGMSTALSFLLLLIRILIPPLHPSDSWSTEMKPTTHRFKQLVRPKETSQLNALGDDSETPTRKRRRSITVRPRPRSPANLQVPTSEPIRQPVPPLADSAILPREFFQIDALELAPRLLGKFLRRDGVVLQITEVEAYRPNDSACHARFGITARTAPVFGPAGHAYVYLCYGLHKMLNVVADNEGVGAAVLIRACSPVSGMETIQQRRGQKTEKPVLLTGPGKVGQALGISTDWSNHPLFSPGGLEILDGPAPESILIGPRVGIEYALPEHVNAFWRFAVAGSPWVSAPRNTLRLM